MRTFLEGNPDETVRVRPRPEARAQVARLIARHQAEGELVNRGGGAKLFRRRYEEADIRLLAATDEWHWTLSSPTRLARLQRAGKVFGDGRFRRLSTLFNGHLYNLRRSRTYPSWQGDNTSDGSHARGAPRPATGRTAGLSTGRHGAPERSRQGQMVYPINMVDEVTQFPFVGSVERIP